MLVLFPFVLLASAFGKIRGGNIIYSICRLWADSFCLFTGIIHKNVYEVPHDKGKSYIFLSNHISYMDIPMMLKSVRGQNFRILGKEELKKIPVFGYIYKCAAVMVNRQSPEHRIQSVKTLTAILQKSISVFICPEGTFNETHQPLKEFYDGAFRIAIETQTPIKPILFPDTYDRLPYETLFSLNPGKCRCVYLEEIKVDDYSIDNVKLLKEVVFKKMEEGLIKYKAGWIQP